MPYNTGMASTCPRIIYHGANTPALLSQSIALPVHGVEFDIRKTSDNVVVVHHGRRVTSQDGRFHFIDQMTYEELKNILGGQIMTFDEALHMMRQAKSNKSLWQMFLDIKQIPLAGDVASVLTSHDIPPSHITICSPDIWTLRELEEEIPGIHIGLTYNPLDKWDLMDSKTFRYLTMLCYYSVKPFLFRLIRRKSANGDIHIASIYHRMVSKKVVRFLHQHRIKVFAWGTENQKKIDAMIEWHIDGMLLKNPDVISYTHEHHR